MEFVLKFVLILLIGIVNAVLVVDILKIPFPFAFVEGIVAGCTASYLIFRPDKP